MGKTVPLTVEQLRSALTLQSIQETALSGHVTNKDSGKAEMELDVDLTSGRDSITVTLCFTVSSPDMLLSTTQSGVWVAHEEALELSSEAVQTFVSDIAVPVIFPYGRAGIDLIASRLGIRLAPLPHFDPEKLERIDSEILLDGADSIVLTATS